MDVRQCATLCDLSNAKLWYLFNEITYGNIKYEKLSWRLLRLENMDYELKAVGLLLDLAVFRTTHTSRSKKGQPILDRSTYYAMLFVLRRHLMVLDLVLGVYMSNYPYFEAEIKRLKLRTAPVFEHRFPSDVMGMIEAYALQPKKLQR